MHWPHSLIRPVGMVAVVAGTVVIASAASLVLGSTTLGSAQVAVPLCTGSGVGVVENLGTGAHLDDVVSLTLSGIAASCDGAALSVTLNSNATPTPTTGTQTWTVVGTGTTLALSTPVPLTSAGQVDLVMTGS